MADVDTYKRRAAELKLPIPGAVGWVDFSIAAPSDIGNDGDFITLVDIPKGVVIIDSYVSHSATLGTGCVLALMAGATVLTGDTTAAQASAVRQTAKPTLTTETTELKIEIETADTTAAATIEAGVLIALDPTYGHIA